MKGKAKLKIAIVLLFLSLILPFLVNKIKPLKFVGQPEAQIASFQLPQIQHFELKEDSITLLNPFRLTDKKTLTQDIKQPLPSLSMIYKGKKHYAVLGDRILGEGEKWGDFKIEKIATDKVLLVNKRGERIWLRMENY